MERIKQYEPLWDAWEIKRKIGEGSFGAVYEVEKISYGITRRAAVKLITFRNTEMLYGIPVDETLSEDAMKKIKEEEAKKNVREVSLMNTLQGSNHIVTIYDFGIIPGESTTDVLILMELLTSLSHYVRNGEVDREFVIKLGIDICKALEACEKEKVVHRDIKPGNIFIDKEGNFKLGDFGLSRKMSRSASESLRKSKGTPLYMSPEAFAWGRQVDHTSDLYSLGIMMYQMLNDGKIPFGTIKEDYDDEERAIGKRLDGKEILPPVHGDGRLWEIIQKATRFKKEERYQRAEAMRRDLEELIQKPKRTAKQEDAEEQYKLENSDYNKKVVCEILEEWLIHNYSKYVFASGERLENNLEKAVQWCEKEAEKGDVRAELLIGLCYEWGVGVKKDQEKALYWYKKEGIEETLRLLLKAIEYKQRGRKNE